MPKVCRVISFNEFELYSLRKETLVYERALSKEEDLELRQLQEKYNRFSAKNLEDDLLMEIYANSLGDRAIPNREEELFNEDLKSTNRVG